MTPAQFQWHSSFTYCIDPFMVASGPFHFFLDYSACYFRVNCFINLT